MPHRGPVTRPGVSVSRSLRAFACAAAVLLVFAVPCAAQIVSDAPQIPVVETYEIRQQASFEIWNGETRLGTEKFRIYATHDTLITPSTVRLDGPAPTRKLPFKTPTTVPQR